ncbi:MAG: hypothetical protein E6K35_03540 [Gammaproteobacteria bacterium]|nr:MAG: hypothetical protein E6K47_07260 [Gammaproteobacteria bacterium]TLY87959.1 MAG: hypothetical protein E6K35_03540 [Gammaproteobacteria bacterium]
MRVLAGAVALAAVSACGGITLKPDPVLPQPLLQPLPSTVGLVLADELRNYVHKETRWGVEWHIALGPGHVHLLHDIFKDSFRQVQEFKDLAAARAGTGLKAVFEPLIDQYSFVIDRDTGGRYDAVTIRYRINVYTPQGEMVDTLTLTGYGSALAQGLSSGKPLERATLAAMRDAAAKFLVQFPQQAPGQQLAHDEPLTVQSGVDTAANVLIEAVPIEESGPDTDAGAPPTPAQPPSPGAVPATPAPPAPAAETPKAPGA